MGRIRDLGVPPADRVGALVSGAGTAAPCARAARCSAGVMKKPVMVARTLLPAAPVSGLMQWAQPGATITRRLGLGKT